MNLSALDLQRGFDNVKIVLLILKKAAFDK